jgi:hypothetical protein
LKDRTKLSAGILPPVDVEVSPFPAIVEYFPYHEGDRTRERDAIACPLLSVMGALVVELIFEKAVDLRSCRRTKTRIEST